MSVLQEMAEPSAFYSAGYYWARSTKHVLEQEWGPTDQRSRGNSLP